jgi:hypothetical protein
VSEEEIVVEGRRNEGGEDVKREIEIKEEREWGGKGKKEAGKE